jgi:hypothetical protein
MSPAVFEPAIPAGERQQNLALDSSATGIGRMQCNIVIFSRIAKQSEYSFSSQTNYVAPITLSPNISRQQLSAFIRLDPAKSDSN